MLKRSMSDYRKEVTLLDGRKIILRPINPEDKKALSSFYNRLSEDTRFLRYDYIKGELTENDLKIYCEIDYERTLGLVAEIGQGDQKEIIGIGQYYRLLDPDIAEVAFVVQDSEQRKGIGTHLLKQLAVIAWEYGVRYFVGEVSRTNGRMLSIFSKSDPHMERVLSGSTCTISLSVREVMHRSPDFQPNHLK